MRLVSILLFPSFFSQQGVYESSTRRKMIASEAIQLGSGRSRRGITIVRGFSSVFLFFAFVLYLTYPVRYDFSPFSWSGVDFLFFSFSLIFFFSCFVSLFSMPATTTRREAQYQHAYTTTTTSRQNIRPKTKYDADVYYRVHECIVVYYIPTYLFLPLSIPFFDSDEKSSYSCILYLPTSYDARNPGDLCTLLAMGGVGVCNRL